MNIRPATPADAGKISELVIATSKTHIGPTLTAVGLENLVGEMSPEKQLERMQSGFRFWLAIQDQRVAGVAALKPPAHLYYLFVATEFQRLGVGRGLFDVVIADVQSGSEQAVTVNASLNSVETYARFGFVTTGPVETRNDVRYQPMINNLDR